MSVNNDSMVYVDEAKNSRQKLQRKDLVYPELCYQIIGILFAVWTEIGFGYKEKIYQSAIEHAFTQSSIKFHRELPVKIQFKGKEVGIYYFDFLVDKKVVLEIKVRNFFSKKDINQLYSYLKAMKLKLGIIAHFTRTGVKFKRIVNLV